MNREVRVVAYTMEVEYWDLKGRGMLLDHGEDCRIDRCGDEDEGVDGEDGPPFDIAKLTQRPLLQSICSEILRLYVAAFIPRGSAHEDFVVADNYKIPKGQLIAVDSYTAHRDTDVWNTGRIPDSHPLDTFWAERFLIYPDDPKSGPLRKRTVSSSATGTIEQVAEKHPSEAKSDKPRFSTEGRTHSWIPYSGGVRHCPGRHFAKREIIVTAAMLVSAFEIELTLLNISIT